MKLLWCFSLIVIASPDINGLEVKNNKDDNKPETNILAAMENFNEIEPKNLHFGIQDKQTELGNPNPIEVPPDDNKKHSTILRNEGSASDETSEPREETIKPTGSESRWNDDRSFSASDDLSTFDSSQILRRRRFRRRFPIRMVNTRERSFDDIDGEEYELRRQGRPSYFNVKRHENITKPGSFAETLPFQREYDGDLDLQRKPRKVLPFQLNADHRRNFVKEDYSYEEDERNLDNSGSSLIEDRRTWDVQTNGERRPFDPLKEIINRRKMFQDQNRKFEDLPNDDYPLSTAKEIPINERFNSGAMNDGEYSMTPEDNDYRDTDSEVGRVHGFPYEVSKKRMNVLRAAWEEILPKIDQFHINWKKDNGSTIKTERPKFRGPFRGWRLRNALRRKMNQDFINKHLGEQDSTVLNVETRSQINEAQSPNAENTGIDRNEGRDYRNNLSPRHFPVESEVRNWKQKPLVNAPEHENSDTMRNNYDNRNAFLKRFNNQESSTKLKNGTGTTPFGKAQKPSRNSHMVNKNASKAFPKPIASEMKETQDEKGNTPEKKNTMLDWREQFMNQIRSGLEWATKSIKKELQEEKSNKENSQITQATKNRDWKGQLQNQMFSRPGLSKDMLTNNANRVGNSTKTNRLSVEELRELWGRQITKQRNKELTDDSHQAAKKPQNKSETPIPDLKTSTLQDSRDAWGKQILGSDHYLQKKYQTAQKVTMGDLRDNWQKQIIDDEQMNITFPTYRKPHFEELMELVQKTKKQQGQKSKENHNKVFRHETELRHKRENFPIELQPKQKRSLIFEAKDSDMNQILSDITTAVNHTQSYANNETTIANAKTSLLKSTSSVLLNEIAKDNSSVPGLESILLQPALNRNTITLPNFDDSLKDGLSGLQTNMSHGDYFEQAPMKNGTNMDEDFVAVNNPYKTDDGLTNRLLNKTQSTEFHTSNKTATESKNTTQYPQRFKKSFQTANETETPILANQFALNSWDVPTQLKPWQQESVRVTVTEESPRDKELETMQHFNLSEPKPISALSNQLKTEDEYSSAEENLSPTTTKPISLNRIQGTFLDEKATQWAQLNPNVLPQKMMSFLPVEENVKLDENPDFFQHDILPNSYPTEFRSREFSPLNDFKIEPIIKENFKQGQQIHDDTRSTHLIKPISGESKDFSQNALKHKHLPEELENVQENPFPTAIIRETDNSNAEVPLLSDLTSAPDYRRFPNGKGYTRQNIYPEDAQSQIRLDSLREARRDFAIKKPYLATEHDLHSLNRQQDYIENNEETVESPEHEAEPTFPESMGMNPTNNLRYNYMNPRQNIDITVKPKTLDRMQFLRFEEGEKSILKHLGTNDDSLEDDKQMKNILGEPQQDDREFEPTSATFRRTNEENTSIIRLLNKMLNEKPIPIPLRLGKIGRPENDLPADEREMKKKANLDKAKKLLEMAPKLNVRKFYDTLATVLSADRNVWQKKFAENPFADVILAKFKEYLPIAFKQAKLNTSYSIKYPKSQELDLTITNVIGVLPGRKEGLPTDDFLIIGAHYDSADSVENSEEFHNRASGIALLLEILRSLASSDWQLENSIYFVAFDLGEVDRVGSSHFVKHYLVPKVIESGRGSLQGAYILNTLMAYNSTPNSQRLPYELTEFVPQVATAVTENKNRGDFYLVSARKNMDTDLAEKLAFYWNLMTNPNFRIHVAEVNLPEVKRHKMHSIFNNGDHRNFWEVGDEQHHVLKAVLIGDTDYARVSGECSDVGCQDFSTITPSSLLFVKKLGEAIIAACLDFGGGRLAEFRSPPHRRSSQFPRASVDAGNRSKSFHFDAVLSKPHRRFYRHQDQQRFPVIPSFAMGGTFTGARSQWP